MGQDNNKDNKDKAALSQTTLLRAGGCTSIATHRCHLLVTVGKDLAKDCKDNGKRTKSKLTANEGKVVSSGVEWLVACTTQPNPTHSSKLARWKGFHLRFSVALEMDSRMDTSHGRG